MLPGVELARRRRVHYHGDVSSSAGAGEHGHGHHHYAHARDHHAGAAAGVSGPALAARIRLEEKLRGAALPSPTSPSRWSRLMRDGRSTSTPRHPDAQSRRDQPPPPPPPQPQQQPEEDALGSTAAELWRLPSPRPAASLLAAVPASRRRAELTRTLSKVDVCAVCLDEVRERQQRVTRLPCSHKYHSECVLPWLAIHPDCPCCRALVPSVDTLG